MTSEKRAALRRWLYGVALAGIAVAVTYGLIDQEQVPLWTTLVVALLAVPVGTAAAHVQPDDGGRWRRGREGGVSVEELTDRE